MDNQTSNMSSDAGQGECGIPYADWINPPISAIGSACSFALDGDVALAMSADELEHVYDLIEKEANERLGEPSSFIGGIHDNITGKHVFLACFVKTSALVL